MWSALSAPVFRVVFSSFQRFRFHGRTNAYSGTFLLLSFVLSVSKCCQCSLGPQRSGPFEFVGHFLEIEPQTCICVTALVGMEVKVVTLPAPFCYEQFTQHWDHFLSVKHPLCHAWILQTIALIDNAAPSGQRSLSVSHTPKFKQASLLTRSKRAISLHQSLNFLRSLSDKVV